MVYKGSRVGTLKYVTAGDIEWVESDTPGISGKTTRGAVDAQKTEQSLAVPDHLTKMYQQGCEHLRPEQRTKFANLCHKYGDVNVWFKGATRSRENTFN